MFAFRQSDSSCFLKSPGLFGFPQDNGNGSLQQIAGAVPKTKQVVEISLSLA